MAKRTDTASEARIDTAIALLKHLLALELYKAGVSHAAIAKHLHVATATVVNMLKGVRRPQ